MSAPLPSQFAALIPSDPDVPTCAELEAIMTGLPALMSQWWTAWYAEDGSLSDDFASAICSLNCDGSTGSSTTDSASTPP